MISFPFEVTLLRFEARCALVVSLSHVLGDGFTFYRLFELRFPCLKRKTCLYTYNSILNTRYDTIQYILRYELCSNMIYDIELVSLFAEALWGAEPSERHGERHELRGRRGPSAGAAARGKGLPLRRRRAADVAPLFQKKEEHIMYACIYQKKLYI